ncbi:porin family protein [candidate division KSB1 bacterium]|nr:porin family protein [candidate division KSB1 bacterium]
MKQLFKMSLLVLALLALLVNASSAQVAAQRQLILRPVSDALTLVGDNSDDSKFGPYFGGSVGYGLGYGVTLFAESGYGWTNYDSNNDLKLRQIPILGGATYNFGPLLNSGIVQPYLGAAAGAFIYRQELNGNLVTVSGIEQKTTNFGLEGIAGVSFKISNSFAFDVRAKYDYVFSDENKPGLESQDWSGIGIGGGISYLFSF